MFCCFLLFPRGRVPLRNWRFMFCILAYLSSPWFSPYSKRGVRLLGNSRFIVCFCWFYFWYIFLMIILIPKKTGIPGSCFCNWSFPNLGEILIHGLSLIQLQVFWNYPHCPSIANGAALLRSSRFIVCYTNSTSYDQSSQRDRCLLGISRFMCVRLF